MIKNFSEYINEDYFSKLASRKDNGDVRSENKMLLNINDLTPIDIHPILPFYVSDRNLLIDDYESFDAYTFEKLLSNEKLLNGWTIPTAQDLIDMEYELSTDKAIKWGYRKTIRNGKLVLYNIDSPAQKRDAIYLNTKTLNDEERYGYAMQGIYFTKPVAKLSDNFVQCVLVKDTTIGGSYISPHVANKNQLKLKGMVRLIKMKE